MEVAGAPIILQRHSILMLSRSFARARGVFATANGSIRVSGMEDINSIQKEPCGRVCILKQRELDVRVSSLKRLNRASDVPDGIM